MGNLCFEIQKSVENITWIKRNCFDRMLKKMTPKTKNFIVLGTVALVTIPYTIMWLIVMVASISSK